MNQTWKYSTVNVAQTLVEYASYWDFIWDDGRKGFFKTLKKKTKQNNTIQNKTKQNKTKQNKTKQNHKP